LLLRNDAVETRIWGAPAIRHLAAILAGALLLLWPALLNGYPIVFSDTHAFLIQGSEPRMVWDKPFAYGPFLRLLDGGITLWGPAIAQALLLSHLMWLTARACAAATPVRHILLCALLAAGSAAPWFAALLMPDIFAPITVLCLFLLGFDGTLRRPVVAWLCLLAAFAIAAHLAHLVIAAAGLATICLVRGRTARAAIPLVLALAALLAGNLIAYGRVAISPYGAVIALARFTADGPAARVIDADCPQSAWRLCAFAGRLPTDSDAFLWSADGPVWSTGGPQALAPEAAAILRRTLIEHPAAVLRTAAANTARQTLRVPLGDTLGNDWLERSIAHGLTEFLPPAEHERFEASRQASGTLAPLATPLNPAHATLLAVGTIATLATLRLWRRDPTRADLAALILACLLANAFATGALSGPHDRYQARIAWLVLVPVGLWRRKQGQGALPHAR
jgi:hypothetical protein